MEMPMIGLGTWQMRGSEAATSVAHAIDIGYRHVDTAQMYENEAEVGTGIRAASVPRDQIFVTTKIHQDRFGEGSALDSAQASIDRIGVGPVDLILCHWPPKDVKTEQVMGDLLAIRDAGLTRHIGISNFNVPQTKRAAAVGPVLTNQVEFHPLIDQSRLLQTARDCGMTLTAYTPIMRGKALSIPTVRDIAAETARSPAAVVLRWIIQQGVIALCKSSNPDRLAGNLEANDFTLTDDQMARITALTAANQRDVVMPDWAPDWDA